MTGLPSARSASVDRRKITEYLLNPDHPRGAAKHDFFVRFGFCPSDADALIDALLQHGRGRLLTKTIPTEYGPRFEIRCDLVTPDGRNPCIVSVWQDTGTVNVPRFITAYPKYG